MINNRLVFAIICIYIVACNQNSRVVSVSTLAGNGSMGNQNGALRQASFSNPMAVAADKGGNVYVADSRNNLIRKINHNGVVSTYAGSGLEGSADGPARTASFFYPQGIAVDKKGNVYVADTHNSLIRKISPDGMVSTIAGRRADQFGRGRDSSVRLDNPSGIAVDEDGNVYIADWANDLIRKINSGGKLTIVAGNGNPGSQNGQDTAASFYLPWGIAVDPQKNLYITDSYNNMIRKVSPNGLVTTIAGHKAKGSSNGKDTLASFLHPTGIAVDQKGNIYVADTENHCIRKILPDGEVSTLAGNGLRGFVDGPGAKANFYRPFGLAVNDRGDIFVADYLNNRIREIHVNK